MVKAETKRSVVHVTASEYGDGQPWIALEPHSSVEDFGTQCFFGIDLKPGTTYYQARALARQINDLATHVCVTTFLESKRANVVDFPAGTAEARSLKLLKPGD